MQAVVSSHAHKMLFIPQNELREEVIENVKWNVNRDSPEDKLRDFLEWMFAVKRDTIHHVRNSVSLSVCLSVFICFNCFSSEQAPSQLVHKNLNLLPVSTSNGIFSLHYSVIPVVSIQYPHSSSLIPIPSFQQSHSNTLIPAISFQYPHSSSLIPIPHSSNFIPIPSFQQSHSNTLIPAISFQYPHSSNFIPKLY